MSCTHGRTRIFLTLVLLLLGGCATPPDLLPPGRERIVRYGTPTDTLRCPSPRLEASTNTQVVDSGGGTVSTGNVQLTIPPRAFARPHRLILHQDSGQFMRARIDVSEVELERQQTGRGVVFQNNQSAQLNFDISSCDHGDQPWSVWRLNAEKPDSSQQLWTPPALGRAITAIDSTSWFIIAN